MSQDQPERLSERVRRLRAPNPGPMTLTGTNSYLVGNGPEIIVIDPGSRIQSHLEALQAATGPASRIGLIVVTHGHPDHFPGAADLSVQTGAPVAAYREAAFPHEVDLDDGDAVQVEGVTLRAIYTPGHAPDHLCFFLEEEQALFTGDNILGQGTTVIAPPKGDMALYMSSLRLLEMGWSHARVIYGGHGPEIPDPAGKIQEYITHRLARQEQLFEAMRAGASTIPRMVEQIYQDVDRRLWPAAARQILAYLIMLEREGRVQTAEIDPSEISASDQNLLNPFGATIDPVAAAELGISTNENAQDKIKRYFLKELPT